MSKIKALAKHLDCEVTEIDQAKYDDNTFEYGREEYRVLTDKEADEAARESILESIWAFNPEFLAHHCKEGVDEETIRAIQSNEKCEDNNQVLCHLIEDINHFVQDPICADGRGHFLNKYDGNEYEVTHDGETYYIYRQN